MSRLESPQSDTKPVVGFEQKRIPESAVPPWYQHEIPRLTPATRALYRNYSRLNDDEIVNHLHSIVRRSTAVWPCKS